MEREAPRVEVQEATSGVGKGLFAGEKIKKDAFIAEYTGRKITTAEADASKSRYIFELDDDWSIDGVPELNIAGYINHSCEPNAEADTVGGHIFISALRDIAAGEEITMDYGKEYYDEFIRPVGCKCAAKKHH